MSNHRKFKRSASVYQNPLGLEKSKFQDKKNKSGDANKAKIKAKKIIQSRINKRSRQDNVDGCLKSPNVTGICKTNVSFTFINF
jgi:hypothetical protein